MKLKNYRRVIRKEVTQWRGVKYESNSPGGRKFWQHSVGAGTMCEDRVWKNDFGRKKPSSKRIGVVMGSKMVGMKMVGKNATARPPGEFGSRKVDKVIPMKHKTHKIQGFQKGGPGNVGAHSSMYPREVAGVASLRTWLIVVSERVEVCRRHAVDVFDKI